MKEINMYLKSSWKVLRDDKLGAWITILEYKGSTRILKGYATNTTDKKMLYTAAINGIRALKEPCKVNVYSEGSISIDGKCKGLKQTLVDEIVNNGHMCEFISQYHNMESSLNKMIDEYYIELGIN